MTQRLKRFATVVGATVLTIGLSGAAYVSAQNSSSGAPVGHQGGGFGPGRGRGGPGGPGAILGPGFDRLDLTDAQKAKVKEILDSHQNDLHTLGTRSMTAHQALDAATTSDSFDEAGVRTRSAELAAIDADMAVMRARVYNEVYQILTPDQQKQLKQLRAEMQQRGAHRGQK
jgi:Spy/CpxP family protein refolding chaperone